MTDLPGVTRREFASAVGTIAMAPAFGTARAETPVASLYTSLSAEQKALLCFPHDHPLQAVFQNNWKIVEPTIGDLDVHQQTLCREIFTSLCSEEGIARFDRQMKDDYGGFAKYHVALFGEPGSDHLFEWVLTGRHLTLRADGNRMTGPGFGGPIFQGHGRRVDRGETNVWWPACELVNTILKSLDSKEKAQAIVTRSQAERTRAAMLRGVNPADTGLEVRNLQASGKVMVRNLLKGLVRPFRDFDAEEVTSCLKIDAGIDALRLSFFEEEGTGLGDLRSIWVLRGPKFSWYFHGSPHVHAWLNITRRSKARP